MFSGTTTTPPPVASNFPLAKVRQLTSQVKDVTRAINKAYRNLLPVNADATELLSELKNHTGDARKVAPTVAKMKPLFKAISDAIYEGGSALRANDFVNTALADANTLSGADIVAVDKFQNAYADYIHIQEVAFPFSDDVMFTELALEGFLPQ